MVRSVQSKLGKKIQKFQVVKKEGGRKVPKVSLVDSAILCPFGLDLREKRRIRERLLQRQVFNWAEEIEVNTNRRELRARK